jgi:hypothetical protein
MDITTFDSTTSSLATEVSTSSLALSQQQTTYTPQQQTSTTLQQQATPTIQPQINSSGEKKRLREKMSDPLYTLIKGSTKMEKFYFPE